MADVETSLSLDRGETVRLVFCVTDLDEKLPDCWTGRVKTSRLFINSIWLGAAWRMIRPASI